MISLTLTNQKEFTKMLFLSDTFDPFEVCDCSFKTFASFHIDGELLSDYFGDEYDNGAAYVTWANIRTICFNIIKGNRLPLSFQIIFRATDAMTDEIRQSLYSGQDSVNDLSLPDSFFWNIYYRDGRLTCTTAVGVSTFSFDKAPERTWDQYILALMDYYEIEYTDDL